MSRRGGVIISPLGGAGMWLHGPQRPRDQFVALVVLSVWWDFGDTDLNLCVRQERERSTKQWSGTWTRRQPRRGPRRSCEGDNVHMSIAEGIHQRCQELIRALDVPVPCREVDLLSAARLYLNRDVRLLEMRNFDLPPGFVIDDGLTAHIFINHDLNPIHRLHVIGHEVGHVLLGHTAGARPKKAKPGLERGRCRTPGPQPSDMPPLGSVDERREHEAEMFALLLLGGHDPETPTFPRPRRAMSQAAVRRLEGAFPRSLAALGAGRERVG